jgi:hypothetical protein
LPDHLNPEKLLKLTGCKDSEQLKNCFVETGTLFTDPVTGEEDFKKYMENQKIV